jgi:hypothetical protein
MTAAPREEKGVCGVVPITCLRENLLKGNQFQQFYCFYQKGVGGVEPIICLRENLLQENQFQQSECFYRRGLVGLDQSSA